MAVYELMRNEETRYAIFAIDEKGDLESLPTSEENSADGLTTCSMGSIARCVDGKSYILNGKNSWVEYTGAASSSGGGSGGGGGGGLPEDYVEASDDDIRGLFK